MSNESKTKETEFVPANELEAENPKPANENDPGGAHFVKELLDGDHTYTIDSDRIQYHPDRGWILFDFLRCVSVPPQQSHPNRYWFKNSRKFQSLWRLAQPLDGTLYLVNYGDDRDLGVRLIHVQDMDLKGVSEENIKNMDWKDFQGWFKTMNRECGPDMPAP